MKNCLYLWVCAALLGGCAGTETGNPSATVAVNTRTSDPQVASLRVSEGGPVVDQAWVTMETIGLLENANCREPNLTNREPLGTGDHAGPEPAFVVFDAAPAEYCQLRIALAPTGTLPDGAPEELRGRAVVVRGRLADGTPFVVSSELSGEIVIAGATPFAVNEDRAAMIMAMDVARWFEDVDLSTATPNPDGTVMINDTENTALRDAFDAAAPLGFELYLDADGDAVLDPSPELLGRGQM
ncbi:MAG: hypothetical protein AAGF12_20135 [Myxococcota bacterium]